MADEWMNDTASARVRRRERLVQEEVINLDGKTLNQRTMQHRLNAAAKARQKQSQWVADHPSSTQWWNNDTATTFVPDLNAKITPVQHASEVDQLWSRRVNEAATTQTQEQTSSPNNGHNDDDIDVELTYLDNDKMVVNQGDLYSPPPMVRRSSYEPPQFGGDTQPATAPSKQQHHRSASEPFGTRTAYEEVAKRPQERPISLEYRACSPEDYLNGQQWICFSNNTYSPPEIPYYEACPTLKATSQEDEDSATFPILGSKRGTFFTASHWDSWNQTAATAEKQPEENVDKNEHMALSKQGTSETVASDASNLSMSDLIRYKNLEPELDDVFAEYSSSEDDDSENFQYMRASFQESSTTSDQDVTMIEAATAEVLEETNQAFWDPATYQPLVDDEEDSKSPDTTSESDSVATPHTSNKESSLLYSVPRKEWYAESAQKTTKKPSPDFQFGLFRAPSVSNNQGAKEMPGKNAKIAFTVQSSTKPKSTSAFPTSVKAFSSVARAVSPLSASSAGSLLRQASLNHKSLSDQDKTSVNSKRSTLSMGPSTKSPGDAKKKKAPFRMPSSASFSSVKELIGQWEQGKKAETPASPGSVKDMIQKWENKKNEKISTSSSRSNYSSSQETDVEVEQMVSHSFGDECFESQEVELQEVASETSERAEERKSRFTVNVINPIAIDTDSTDKSTDTSTNDSSNIRTDECIRPYPDDQKMTEAEVPKEVVCCEDDDNDDDDVKEVKTEEREAVLSLLRKAYMSIRSEKTLSVKKKRPTANTSMDDVSEISDSENAAETLKDDNDEKRVAMNVLCEPSAGAVEVLLRLPELSKTEDSADASDDSIVVVSLPDKGGLDEDTNSMEVVEVSKNESLKSSTPRVTVGEKESADPDKPFDEGEDEEEPVWIEVEEQGPHDEV